MREESQPQRGEVGLAGVSGLLLRLSDPSCPLLFTQPHARFQPLQKGPCWPPHQLSLFISCSGSALKSSLPGPSLARSLGLAPSGSAPFMPFSGGWCGSHAHQLPGTAEGSVVCSHTSRPLGSGDSVGQPEQGPELAGVLCLESGADLPGRGWLLTLSQKSPTTVGRQRAHGPFIPSRTGSKPTYSRCSQ